MALSRVHGYVVRLVPACTDLTIVALRIRSSVARPISSSDSRMHAMPNETDDGIAISTLQHGSSDSASGPHAQSTACSPRSLKSSTICHQIVCQGRVWGPGDGRKCRHSCTNIRFTCRYLEPRSIVCFSLDVYSTLYSISLCNEPMPSPSNDPATVVHCRVSYYLLTLYVCASARCPGVTWSRSLPQKLSPPAARQSNLHNLLLLLLVLAHHYQRRSAVL